MTEKQRIAAEKRFIKKLNEAIEACFEARMENNAAVMTMPINALYIELTRP